MSVHECVALHNLAAVLSIGTLSQCLILDVFARSGLEILSRFVVEDAAHHSVEQHGYATTFTRLAHEFTQVIVEGRSRVCVAVGLGLLVVVAKLDEHVVARLDAIEHGLPKSAVDERLRRAAVLCVVVHTYILGEAVLEHHAPTAFHIAVGDGLVGHCGVADGEDCDGLVFLECRQADDDHCRYGKRQQTFDSFVQYVHNCII